VQGQRAKHSRTRKGTHEQPKTTLTAAPTLGKQANKSRGDRTPGEDASAPISPQIEIKKDGLLQVRHVLNCASRISVSHRAQRGLCPRRTSPLSCCLSRPPVPGPFRNILQQLGGRGQRGQVLGEAAPVAAVDAAAEGFPPYDRNLPDAPLPAQSNKLPFRKRG